MRILISVYNEDKETDIYTHVISKHISTDWSIAEIDKHFQLYDGFRSELVVGRTLSFWDIYCYFADTQYLVAKIESIPIGGDDEIRVGNDYSIMRIEKTIKTSSKDDTEMI